MARPPRLAFNASLRCVAMLAKIYLRLRRADCRARRACLIFTAASSYFLRRAGERLGAHAPATPSQTADQPLAPPGAILTSALARSAAARRRWLTAAALLDADVAYSAVEAAIVLSRPPGTASRAFARQSWR